MLELPLSQRPVSGSEGAQRRREQLERQVPPHDVDPSRCHSLSEAEVCGLESYREHLREGAVGQGRVATLAAMLQELGLPYAISDAPKPFGTSISDPGQNIQAPANASQPTANNNNNNADDSFPPPPSPGTLSQLHPPDFPSAQPPPPPLPDSMPPLRMQRPSAFLPKVQVTDQNQNVPTFLPHNKPNREVPTSLPVLSHPIQHDLGKLQQDIETGSRSFMDRGGQGGLAFSCSLPMIEEVKSPGFESDPVSNQTARAIRYDNNNSAGELPGELAGNILCVLLLIF